MAVCDRCGAEVNFDAAYACYCAMTTNDPALVGPGYDGPAREAGPCCLCGSCGDELITDFNLNNLPDGVTLEGTCSGPNWQLQFEAARDAGILVACIQSGLTAEEAKQAASDLAKRIATKGAIKDVMEFWRPGIKFEDTVCGIRQ